MKKKGFTLIELLAVIVILAIIALIAVPVTLGIIDNARKNSFKNSLMNMFKAAEFYEANNDFQKIDVNGIGIEKLNISNNHYTGRVIRDDGVLTLITVGDENYCGSGTMDDLIIQKGSCSLTDNTEASFVGLKDYYITTNKLTVTFTATDYESGIKSYLYCFAEAQNDCDQFIETSIPEAVFNNLTPNTNYKLILKAKNGNDIISNESKVFTFTTPFFDAPECSINTNEWRQEVYLTCNYKKQSGVRYLYSMNNIDWLEEENDTIGVWSENDNVKILTRKITENGTIYARTTDGNTNMNAQIEITNVDNGMPSMPILTSSSATSSVINATYTSSSALSGIREYKCYYGDTDNPSILGNVNGTSCTFNNLQASKTYYFKMCALSNAGKEICSEIQSKATQVKILSSTNNCINLGSTCPSGTIVNVKVNANESYDFYVISDDGTKMTLMRTTPILNPGYDYPVPIRVTFGMLASSFENYTGNWSYTGKARAITINEYNTLCTNGCPSWLQELSASGKYNSGGIWTNNAANGMGAGYKIVDNKLSSGCGYVVDSVCNDSHDMVPVITVNK